MQFLQLDVKLHYSDPMVNLRKMLSQQNHLTPSQMKKRLIVSEMKQELTILREQDYLVSRYS